jgi:hypothetical protein
MCLIQTVFFLKAIKPGIHLLTFHSVLGQETVLVSIKHFFQCIHIYIITCIQPYQYVYQLHWFIDSTWDTKQVGGAVKSATCIQKVPDLNFGQYTGYPELVFFLSHPIWILKQSLLLPFHSNSPFYIFI